MLQPNRNITFPAVTGINVKDITPRIGASYDLFGNGKTALKVSVGKYPLGVSTVGNPAGHRQHRRRRTLDRREQATSSRTAIC